MNIKSKPYYFAIFLLYMVDCKHLVDPTQPAPRSALPQDGNRQLRSTGGLYRPTNRGGGRRFRNDLPPGGTSRSLGDVTGAAVTSVTGEGEKSRGNLRRELVSPGPPSDGCIPGKVEAVTRGRVYISGQLEIGSPSVGYQADSAFPGQERVRGHGLGPSEFWERLQPVVECGDSAMTVTFRRRRASQVLLDRANESSVPLSRPPPRCGYSVQTTWRDLRLMAQYDACHVTRKRRSYELPLLWRETPVKVSCPASHGQSQSDGPLSVCCFTHGMSVKVRGASAAELLRVNVRGHWTPLLELVETCGFTLDEQDREISIAAPFINCGITVMNGKHTLSVQLGNKKFTLACPVSNPEEHALTFEDVIGIPDPPAETAEHSSESLKNFVWTPPFYLAPPLYPHPTYHNYYHANKRDPSTSLPPSPAPTYGPPSFPPVGPLTEYQDDFLYPDSHQRLAAHDSHSSTGDMESSGRGLGGQQDSVFGVFEQHRMIHSPSSRFQVQGESPSLVPSTHTFNQYYHYYHHPKIPLPGAPQPAASEVESPPVAPVVHHPGAAGCSNTDQFIHSQPGPATHVQAAPNAWYPAQPYLDPRWYSVPHVPDNDAPKLTPFSPDLPATRNESSHQSSEWKPGEPDWRRYEPLSDKDENSPELNVWEVPPPGQPPLPSTNVPAPPLYHLLHHYYLTYPGPERSWGGVPQTPSNHHPQLNTEPTYAVHHFPFYDYNQPEVSPDDQDVPYGQNPDPRPEPQLLSDSHHPFAVWLAQLAQAGYPSMLQANPSHGMYPHNMGGEYPHVEAPVELLDNEIEEATTGFPDVTCRLQRLNLYPSTDVDECGINKDVNTLGLLETYPSYQDSVVDFLNPSRLEVEYGSPGEVRLQPGHRPSRSTETSAAAQLRIATDQTFTSFHPEARLPLSLVQGKPVYAEVSLLDPTEPGMVLLVHSCLAYTQTPYPNWVFIYDGCSSRNAAQLLPSPHSQHIRRFVVFNFLSVPSQSPTSFNKGGFYPEDPEVFFWCSTSVCSPVDGGCIEGCVSGSNNDV